MERPLRTLVVGAAVLSALALAGCATGTPGATQTPAPTDSATVSPSPTATPSATPTETPVVVSDDIALPADCTQIYSASMLAHMEQSLPVLNDPGVDMLPSMVVQALETIDAAEQSLRCTWGRPSEVGLVTNVSVVTPAQVEALQAALTGAGVACESVGEGTLCSLREDDGEHVRGETHYFRGNGWVVTGWLNAEVEGYTDDIVATLWS